MTEESSSDVLAVVAASVAATAAVAATGAAVTAAAKSKIGKSKNTGAAPKKPETEVKKRTPLSTRSTPVKAATTSPAKPTTTCYPPQIRPTRSSHNKAANHTTIRSN